MQRKVTGFVFSEEDPQKTQGTANKQKKKQPSSPFNQIPVLFTEKLNQQGGEKTSLESSYTLKRKEPQFVLCPLGMQKGLAPTIILPRSPMPQERRAKPS